MSTYPQDCSGTYLIGTACGYCARCARERFSMQSNQSQQKLKEQHRNDNPDIGETVGSVEPA
jgi:bacterioferritin-associated ferredoxin